MRTILNFDDLGIMMKKLILAGFLLFGAMMYAFAQDTETEPVQVQQDTKAQERIKNLRIAFISEKLGLTPDQAEKFWPIYRQFVQERNGLRKELKTAQLSVSPNNTDPAKQQQVIDLGLKIKQRELDLEKTYSGRLLQVINPQQMLNLHKAEKESRSMIINQLQQRRLVQQRKENFRDKNQLLKQRDK
jgi:Spy/CpxP family protein refolding chaperone